MSETTPSAQAIREAIQAADPALLALADGLRARFGARLTALRTEGLSVGWAKWEAERSRAVSGFVEDFTKSREEWRKLKAEAISAGAEVKRKPSLRKRA